MKTDARDVLVSKYTQLKLYQLSLQTLRSVQISYELTNHTISDDLESIEYGCYISYILVT